MAGCAGAGHVPPEDRVDPEAPRPPGVAIDPSPRLPPPASEADTVEGVTVLQAPPDSALAFRVVQSFFRAIVEESPAELDATLTEDARFTLTGGGQFPARNSWRARLVRLDYHPLENQLLYHENQVETYRMVGGVLPRGRLGPLPIDVSGEDILLRVPILASRVGSTRVFGDEMWFLLKPGPNGYRIAELIENFQLP